MMAACRAVPATWLPALLLPWADLTAGVPVPRQCQENLSHCYYVSLQLIGALGARICLFLPIQKMHASVVQQVRNRAPTRTELQRR